MAEKITMPRLSDTMEEGTVVKWHKNVGDKVSEGDILAEIETDKAIQEFESEYDGVLLHQGIEEGKSAKVDTILAIIGEEGEAFSTDSEESSTEKNTEEVDTKSSAEEEAAEAQSETSEETETSGEIPEGVNVITMPRLSDTMEEGTVAKWHKKVGDKVAEGDILAEIETDKAVQEFESEYDGTLLFIGSEEGKSAPVDSILAIIGPEGTDVSGISADKPKKKAETPKEEKKESKQPEAKPVEVPKEEKPKTVAATSGERIFASPLAKKLAEEKGIDLSQVEGS